MIIWAFIFGAMYGWESGERCNEQHYEVWLASWPHHGKLSEPLAIIGLSGMIGFCTGVLSLVLSCVRGS